MIETVFKRLNMCVGFSMARFDDDTNEQVLCKSRGKCFAPESGH